MIFAHAIVIESILSPNILIIGSLIIFILDHLAIVLMNPAIVSESTKSERDEEIVEGTASRSVGLIALVLVVINVIISDSNNPSNLEVLAIAALVLATGFLMISFILEYFGTLRQIWFRVQYNSMRYAGLLLFIAMYFYVDSELDVYGIKVVLGIFVLLSWILWFYHEFMYISEIQAREWQDREETRSAWIRNRLP